MSTYLVCQKTVVLAILTTVKSERQSCVDTDDRSHGDRILPMIVDIFPYQSNTNTQCRDVALQRLYMIWQRYANRLAQRCNLIGRNG
ncbi:hypothetical protein [Nostoc punctiforme]|uniref:hypothetical protein n=1 Tax=Nostoc punctiforme TaxID=272131 RepID=UPI0016822B31|nr:hypothetical protein [Nostoc punctiforme]